MFSVCIRPVIWLLLLVLCLSVQSTSVWARSANASALSDPDGTGRPSHSDNPQTTDLSIKFHIHGYYRVRWSMLNNLDMDRGPTPSTGKPIFPEPLSGSGAMNTADMRLRLDLSMEIARSVRVVMRIDALDNLVLGSTPNGFPRTGRVPSIIATDGQAAPTSGVNSFLNSVNLSRAYGEVILPFGYLAAGRMGALTPWGLGLAVHSGNDLDADVGDIGDRVVLAVALLGHIAFAAYDWSASGPVVGMPGGVYVDVEPSDNVRSYAFAFGRFDSPEGVHRKLRAKMPVINYGLLFSYRHQDADVPGYYDQSPDNRTIQRSELVDRSAWSILASLWFLFRIPWLRVELEAVYAQGEIGNSSLLPGVRLTKPLESQQFGGALQVAIAPPKGRWGVGFEFGLASGDDAPGFGVNPADGQIRSQKGDLDGPQIDYPNDVTANNYRFHPNYRIDQIFWRRIVGQVSDAIYVKGASHFDVSPRFRLWTSVLYSRAFEDSTPPGGDANLGVEWDIGIRYHYDPGFEVRFTFATFFPMAGLRNPTLNLEPTPAVATHLVLGYVF